MKLFKLYLIEYKYILCKKIMLANRLKNNTDADFLKIIKLTI